MNLDDGPALTEREKSIVEGVARIRRELAQGMSEGPTLTNDVIDRIRLLLPPVPPEQLSPALLAALTPPPSPGDQGDAA